MYARVLAAFPYAAFHAIVAGRAYDPGIAVPRSILSTHRLSLSTSSTIAAVS